MKRYTGGGGGARGQRGEFDPTQPFQCGCSELLILDTFAIDLDLLDRKVLEYPQYRLYGCGVSVLVFADF